MYLFQEIGQELPTEKERRGGLPVSSFSYFLRIRYRDGTTIPLPKARFVANLVER